MMNKEEARQNRDLLKEIAAKKRGSLDRASEEVES
jgi:hypothetical protein